VEKFSASQIYLLMLTWDYNQLQRILAVVIVDLVDVVMTVVVVVLKELIKVETVTNQVLAVRTVAVVESDKIYLN
jgi:hypothetical protein